jgi:dTDP-4-amino-4,6-dideoxygalactose transaminase
MNGFRFSPISISLSPNVQRDDVFLTLKTILSPWTWKNGKEVKELEDAFKNFFSVYQAFSFNSGRSSLMAILYALNIGADDEVLIQAYTCNAVSNSIIWSGAKPVYVDIKGDDDLTIDIDDLEKKITKKSKAIIIQHTFGFIADVDKVLVLAKKYNLRIVEDCAHTLGAEYRGKKIGSFGDASFFSFGRDKVISSVFGGMVLTDNAGFAERINEFQKKCGNPSNFWIFKQLLHPIIFSLALPVYNFFGLGKIIILFFQKIGLLSKAVTKGESQGRKPEYFPFVLPSALAVLAMNQFKKADKFNKHRQEIADFYEKHLGNQNHLEKKNMFLLKYPIVVKSPKALIRRARAENIILNDGWFGSPIAPLGTNLLKMHYNIGSCPKAEKASESILNLPTHVNISLKQAEKILKCIQSKK